MTDKPVELPSFRLAIRAEGLFVNAYLAPVDSMEGAIHIGSIARKMCDDWREIFDQWLALMTKALALELKAVTGADPTWNEPTPAPESERAGNG